jgi:uncharacterized membrane protein YtjA (UPF0391 family)
MALSRACEPGVRARFRQIMEDPLMLWWAAVFFIIAIIAAVLGFGGLAVASASIAKILFFVFLVFFLITLVAHLLRGRGSNY